MRICSLVFCAAAISVNLTFDNMAFGQSNKIDPPPMPDFKTPVDYTGWYFNQFAPKTDSDALPLYEPILFGKKGKPLSANFKSKAGAQLLELLGNPQDWKPSEKPELAEWTSRIEKTYKQPFLDAATKKHMSVRRLKNLKFLFDRPTSKFVNGRAVGQMMFARAWRVDARFVFSDYLTQAATSNLAFADHMSHFPSLDEQFFAAGHRNMIYTQVLTALRSFMHRIHVWDEISASFDRFDSVPVTQQFARSLYFAEASALQQLQHFCMGGNTSAKNNGASAKKDGPPRIDQAVVKRFFEAISRHRIKRAKGCDKLANADPVKLAQAIHDYYEQMRLLLAKPFVTNLPEELARIKKNYWENKPGMECLVKPIGFAVQTSFRTETLRRGTRLFLEKALEYKRTGVWPRSLDGVKNPAVAACRIDPYTGQDFLFRPNGDVELVYSVGIDGKDDKGDTRDDIVIWTRVYTEKQGVVRKPTGEKEKGKKEKAPTPSEPPAPTPAP